MRSRSLFGLLFVAAAPLAAIEFEPNIGQMPASYRFAAKNRHGEILGEASGNLTYRTRHKENVTIAWQSAKPGTWNAEQPTARRVRYCIAGAHPESCEKGTSTYSRMRRPALYEGVDLVVHAANGAFEYDLELQPGAPLEEVRFELLGDTQPQLDANGRIVAGNVVHWRPVAWQTDGATRHIVDCQLRQISDRVFGFTITGQYRKDLPLIIDPVIETARVITGPEQGEDKILGSAGDHTFGVSRRAGSDNWDVFVTANVIGGGTSTTYWGGDGDEQVHGFRASNDGRQILLTGSTSSRNTLAIGPGARTAYQGGPTDGFVLEIYEATIYRGLLVGGPGADRIHGAMYTESAPSNPTFILIGETDDPNWSGYSVSGQAHGGTDAIAVAYSSNGGSLIVLGGSGDDRARLFRTVAATPPYMVIAGETESPDFPGKTTPGKDLWFARFSTSPLQIETPKTWGGEGDESLAGFEVIANHGLMLAGTTNSKTLPGVPRDQPGFNGGTSDGFVAWLNPLDFTPIQSRYLGGPATDGILSLAIRQNDLYLAGFTDSTTLSLPEMMSGSDPAGLEDGLFIHTDALLNPITAYRAGGSGNDRFTSAQPRDLGLVDLTGSSESRSWLATLESTLPPGDAAAGFSISLRYAATAATEFNAPAAQPILTLGRDLRVELIITTQHEPASDGILIVRSLDPSKLRVNGEGSVLLSRAGEPQSVVLEALSDEGEVDVLISGRAASALPIRYPERRVRVRLVPTRAFIPANPDTTWIVRRGFDFNVPVQFAQVLPNGEPGVRRNVRDGANVSFHVTSSDPAITEPTGAEPRFESAGVFWSPFRALREGIATLTLESTGIPVAPGQQQRVRISDTDFARHPWALSRTLMLHHVGVAFVDLAAGDRLQFTAEDPSRVAIGLSDVQFGSTATVSTPGTNRVIFTALQAGAPARFRVEGSVAGKTVDERFEVLPVPYVLVRGQNAAAATVLPGSTPNFSLRVQPKSAVPAGSSFTFFTIPSNSPLALASLVFSSPGIVEQASRRIDGANITIGLRALRQGKTSISLDIEGAPAPFEIEVGTPRIRFQSPIIVPTASRVSLSPAEILLPARSFQAVRLRVSDPQLFGLEWGQMRGADLTVNFAAFFLPAIDVKGPPGSEGLLLVSSPDTEEFAVPIKVMQKVLLPRFQVVQPRFFPGESATSGYRSYSLAAFDPSATIANGRYRVVTTPSDGVAQRISIRVSPEGICTMPSDFAGREFQYTCQREGAVKIDLQGAGLSEQQEKLDVTLIASKTAAAPISANLASAPFILAAGTQRELSLVASNTRPPALFNGTITSSDPERVKLATASGRLGTGQITIANSAPATVQGFGSEGVVWLKAESNDGLFRTEIPVILFPATMAVRTNDFTPQPRATITADTPSITATVAPLAVDPTSGLMISGPPLALRAGTEPFFLKTKSSDEKVASPTPPDVLFSDLERSRDTTFKINGAGSAALSVDQPPGFVESRDAALRLTVVERVLRLNISSAPAGLQSFASVSASGQGGSGQVPLTLTSLDPTKLRIATDRTATGAASLTTTPGRNFLVQVLRTAQAGEKLRLQMSGPGLQESIAEILVSEPILAWTDPAPAELQPGSANTYAIRFGPVDPYNPQLVQGFWNGALLPGEQLRVSLRSSDPSIVAVPASIDVSFDGVARVQLRALRPGATELSVDAPPEINNRVRIAPIRVKLWEFVVSASEIGSRGLWTPLIIPNQRDEPTVVSVSGTGAAFALAPTALPASTIQVTIPPRARSTIYFTALGNFVSSIIRLNAQDFAEHRVSSTAFESYLNFPANPLQASLSARTATVQLRLISAGSEKPLAAAPFQVELRSSDSRIVRVVNPQVEFNTGQSSTSVTLEFLAPGTAVITTATPAALGANAGVNPLTVVVR